MPSLLPHLRSPCASPKTRWQPWTEWGLRRREWGGRWALRVLRTFLMSRLTSTRPPPCVVSVSMFWRYRLVAMQSVGPYRWLVPQNSWSSHERQILKRQFFAIILLPLFLSACGGVRLQTKSEALNELNKSLQFDAEKQCDKYSGQQYQDCRRQVKEQYEALRKKNTEG